MDAHPVAVDVVVLVVVLLLGWVQTDEVGLTGPLWEVLGGPWLIANVLTAAATLLRRRHGFVALAVVTAAALIMTAADQGPLAAPLAVCVYALAVHRSTRAAAVGAGVATVAVLAVTYIAGSALTRTPFFAISAAAVALMIGSGVGDRRRYTAALIERAAQLAEERDQRARLEVAAERSRIARELHDVVAHGLSVIVRLSDGAEAVAESDPARSREAVRQVGHVGRDSLRDMRRLLGVLGDDAGRPAELAPQPGLADLDALVDTYRTAGLPVAVQRSGDEPLDAAAQLVVFRTVQEGLTNALRYARLPGRVLVRVHLARPVEVEVADDGAAGEAASVGSGRGLVGLRERAALYGGSVEAGPRADLDGRGWRLLLRFDAGTTGEDEG